MYWHIYAVEGHLWSVKLILPIPGLQMALMEKVRRSISNEVREDNTELSAENQDLKVREKQTISLTPQISFAQSANMSDNIPLTWIADTRGGSRPDGGHYSQG